MTNTSPTEPFRFTDADGDYLHIGIPNSPTTGHPAISFHTLAEPVHVPVEEIEGLITALRRLVAAQSAAPAVVEPPTTRPAEPVREQLLHCLDFSACQTHGYASPEKLLAAYDTSRTPTDQTAPVCRDAEGCHRVVPCDPGCGARDLLAEATRPRTQPADRAAVLRWAADRAYQIARRLDEQEHDERAQGAWDVENTLRAELRRMADETATTETTTAQAAIDRVRTLHRKATHGETCVYCAHGQRLGYDTTWPCDTIRALDGTDQPAAGARQDGTTS